MNEEAYHAILRRLGVERTAHPATPENRRVVAFRRQFEEWKLANRPGVPLLTLPDAPRPEIGRCVSCGETTRDEWRCTACLRALHVALSLPAAL